MMEASKFLVCPLIQTIDTDSSLLVIAVPVAQVIADFNAQGQHQNGPWKFDNLFSKM